jgi:hypothetical protein
MNFYQAYGLNIQSELAFPEMIPISATKPDVVIKFGQVDRSLMKVNRLGTYLHATPEKVAFFWKEVGSIEVSQGKEIILDPLPDVEERLLRLPILGIVLGVIVHQRGFLALHASAIAINGSAAIFIAGRGWGKSTLAATLYGRGHYLISDDLVTVDINGSGIPMVLPGFPQLKLLPEAAAFALGDDPYTLPPLAKGYEKRSRRNIERFPQDPLPLRGIYQLDKGDSPALKLLSPQEALVQLIGNSYIARASTPLLEGLGGTAHFHRCMSVLKQVAIYRLERPQVLELVPEIAKLVEANLAPYNQLTTV